MTVLTLVDVPWDTSIIRMETTARVCYPKRLLSGCIGVLRNTYIKKNISDADKCAPSLGLLLFIAYSFVCVIYLFIYSLRSFEYSHSLSLLDSY